MVQGFSGEPGASGRPRSGRRPRRLSLRGEGAKGRTRVTARTLRAPRPAVHVLPVHGYPPTAGTSAPADAATDARASGTVRPT
jgi:hypothetical protein